MDEALVVSCSQSVTIKRCVVVDTYMGSIYSIPITGLWSVTLYGCPWMSFKVCVAAVLLVSYACGQLSSLLASSSVLHLCVYVLCIITYLLMW